MGQEMLLQHSIYEGSNQRKETFLNHVGYSLNSDHLSINNAVFFIKWVIL